MFRKPLLLALLLLASVGVQAIDCKRASTAVEKTICKSKDLVLLDTQLNQIYQHASKQTPASAELTSSQRAWIEKSRNACTTDTCLAEAYNKRITEIESVLAPSCQSVKDRLVGGWVQVSGSGFFQEFATEADGSFESWLHHRPETSGTWQLKGCDFIVKSSAADLTVELILIDATPTELRFIELQTPGIARYKKVH